MARNYPVIRIETIDKDSPPTSHNIRVLMDGKDISTSTTGIEVAIHAGKLSKVTLHLYANVEVDGFVLKDN